MVRVYVLYRFESIWSLRGYKSFDEKLVRLKLPLHPFPVTCTQICELWESATSMILNIHLWTMHDQVRSQLTALLGHLLIIHPLGFSSGRFGMLVELKVFRKWLLSLK